MFIIIKVDTVMLYFNLDTLSIHFDYLKKLLDNFNFFYQYF